MNRIKVLVLVLFAFFGAVFFLLQPGLARVEGSVAAALAAPTGVIASDSQYSTKVSIHWDTIRNATLYRVFRNTVNNGAAATDVGTTAANYFFDETGVQGQTYFYWVRAENSGSSSPLSTPDSGTRTTGLIIPGPFEPLEPPTAPAGNAVTAAKAYLGKALFWDEQMSSTRTVSCGTCHRPAEGGSDPRTVVGDMRSRNPGFDNTFNTPDDVFGSPGVPQTAVSGAYFPNQFFAYNEQVTGRKSPSYLNAGYSANLFWDGRAPGEFRDQLTNNVVLASGGALESQSAGPPLSSAEMAHTGRNWSQVATRIQNSKPLALAGNVPNGLRTWIGRRTYPELFQEAFGTPDVTPARIALAIGTHERTLFSDQTPFDRAIMQIQPLTQQEESGRAVYDRVQCGACHGGSLFTDNGFHNIGVRPQAEDRGRGAITGVPDDDARFKTPGLRNVELHAPYMHNGRFATLEEVVEFYDRGGDFDAPNIDRDRIRPLNLTTQEKADLVAFMKRPFTDPRVANELPPFDRPQLYTESNRMPQIMSTGRTGSGGFLPNAIAIEPPVVGNPSFTVAVSNSLGGAQGVLVIDTSDPGAGTTIPAGGSFARVQTTLTGSGAGNGYASASLAIADIPAMVGRSFVGRWYITDPGAANGFSVSRAIHFTIFGAATAQKAVSDFDGDGKSDVSVYRDADGDWYQIASGNNGYGVEHFGLSGDKIVPGDYDGDGKTDLAVFRPSTSIWYRNFSTGGVRIDQFGLPTDLPVQGDYDGDGKTDIAVYRPSEGIWYLQQSMQGFRAINFGLSSDKPVPGDYDGDGVTDVAVYRPSEGIWYILQSTDGFRALNFGIASDKVVPADYDGDGKTDIAVFRDSTGDWYALRSMAGLFVFRFGIAGDVPAPGDYDGDGKADITVYRPSQGTWFRMNSANSSFFGIQFGNSLDKPIASGYVPVQ